MLTSIAVLGGAALLGPIAALIAALSGGPGVAPLLIGIATLSLALVFVAPYLRPNPALRIVQRAAMVCGWLALLAIAGLYVWPR